MMDDDLVWMPATELTQHVQEGQISALEVAEAMITRVEQINPALNALVHFDSEQIRADAIALDRRRTSGHALGPLHGVPYTIKDMTDVAGLPTTNGIKLMRANVPTQDAIVAARMKGAGGLLLGKTNVPQFGYYGGTDNGLFGPTHNPWKLGYSAGGSSGGAAAAVASGMGPLAEGTDGAGSVRIPAALCGVVGMKPTSGIVPPVMPFIDWVFHGPLSRTVSDSALMLQVLSGHEPSRPPSAPLPAHLNFGESGVDLSGLRVAWTSDLGLAVHLDSEVRDVAYEAALSLEVLGARVTEASPAWANASEAMWNGLWVPAYGGLMTTLDMDKNPQDYDDELHRIRRDSQEAQLKDWGVALLQRVAMRNVWHDFMRDFDLVLSPTLASATFPLDQFAPAWLQDAPVREQVLGWLLTYPFNMLNSPAISVPGGFTSDGRPVGLQIAGRNWEDLLVLRAARALEQVRPWSHHKPPTPLADSERT